MKKLTHIVYYKYQQRSLQRWVQVLTRNSSNSRPTSLQYFNKIHQNPHQRPVRPWPAGELSLQEVMPMEK